MMFACVLIVPGSLVIMENFEIAENPAQFAFPQSKSSGFFARAVDVNRRRDDPARFQSRFNLWKKIALQGLPELFSREGKAGESA